MQRLTKRTQVGDLIFTDIVGVPQLNIPNEYKRVRVQEVIERLADYEEAQDSGLIYVTPRNIGEMIWDKEVRPWIVESIEFKSPRRVYLHCSSRGEKRAFCATKFCIGKSIFFDKDEAENAYWEG